MRPRIFKRWNSTVPSPPLPRKGRKGFLYVPEAEHPPPTPEEEVRIIRRRHQKAERDERMDITLALTPPKTYMSGFTRPRDLRASNWFPGGVYHRKGKVYEQPPESAYEPHTVFLLETRYRVRHGIGRVDSVDHIIGVCRAVDFVKLVKKYNSLRCPRDGRESLDNACWPFIPKSGKVLKRTKWWGPDENFRDIMRELYEGGDYDEGAIQQALLESEEEMDESEDGDVQAGQKQVKSSTTATETRPNMSSSPKSELPPESSQSEPVLPPATAPPLKESPARVDPQPAPLSTTSSQAIPAHLRRELAPDALHQAPPHLPQSRPGTAFPDAETLRSMYAQRIKTKPFWRPLLAVTVSTRPLALSLSRLSKAHERGLPFYASISNDDRKCLTSFGPRVTNLRLNRLLQLTCEMTMRLAGYKGGFVGIRFGTHELGRGIGGEGLADPILHDKRVIKVRVGRWYRRAQEVFESYQEGGQEWGGPDAVDVSFMNEWGYRFDANGNEVPLEEDELSLEDIREVDGEEDVAEDVDEEQDEDRLLRNPRDPVRITRFKPVLRGEDEAAAALRRKLALRAAQRHGAVSHV